MKLDVLENRRTRSWSTLELLGRFLWALTGPAFRYSPRVFWGWRRALLRLFGARVGKQVHVYPSVSIAVPWNIVLGNECAVGAGVRLYSLGVIEVGDRVTLSQGAHLCAGTHDYSLAERPLLKVPISIEHDAWVAADAFIGPGVSIGERSIVGARSVVVKNVPEDVIVAGNPARIVRHLC